MRPRIPIQALSLILLAALCGVATSQPEHPSIDPLFSAAPAVLAETVQRLRAEGQSGVDALMASIPDPSDPRRASFERLADRVCAQRDCAASGLFWHTDLDLALAEAKRSQRPVLSLRLLGRLDEDRSCANSRFFRTALYPDPRIASFLRRSFVLHWSSERPVPALRIDFGDGRTLHGTITGNSVHYVLDANGRLLDALPGLYGPGLFLERLNDLERLAKRLGRRPDPAFEAARARYHRERSKRLTIALTARLTEATDGADPPRDRDAPTAREASERAMTKSIIEAPVLDALTMANLATTGTDPFWRMIANQKPEAWRLSHASRAFLLRKHGVAGKEDGGRVLTSFEAALALDTVRNEYQLHQEIHRWLGDPDFRDTSIEAFNRRVYSELFLTPASDPWLGLRSPDTYLALDIATDRQPLTQPSKNLLLNQR